MNLFFKKFYFPLIVVFCLLPIVSIQGQNAEMEVVLTWSTDTYAPPNYYGKALPAKGSFVEVAANIFSREVAPQELIYNWFLDGRVQRDDSGKGKQIFKFNMGETSSKKSVRLEIKNEEGSALGEPSYLSIEPREPEIVIETGARLLEYFGQIPKYQVASKQKVVFTARPYFFNIQSVDELYFQWNFGGEEAAKTDGNNPNVFTLQVGELAVSFTRNLEIKVENKNNLLQKTRLTAEITLKP